MKLNKELRDEYAYRIKNDPEKYRDFLELLKINKEKVLEHAKLHELKLAANQYQRIKEQGKELAKEINKEGDGKWRDI